MRQLLLILALAFLFSLTAPAVFAEDKAPNREKAKTNVIVIFIDDLGFADVQPFSNSHVTSFSFHPHLKGKTPHFFRMRIQ